VERNSESISKIGSYMPQLSQKDCVGGILFWLTVYTIFQTFTFTMYIAVNEHNAVQYN